MNFLNVQRQQSTLSWLHGFAVVGILLACGILWFASGRTALTLEFYLLFALTLANSGLLLWLRARLSQQDSDEIRQRSRLLDHLREATAQEERNRLARDLHDTIKQHLFSMNIVAATAQSLVQPDPNAAAVCLQEIRTLAQAALSEMKALLTQLRPNPLDNIGLLEAIREQLDALHFRAEVETELHCADLPDSERLPIGAQESIFRAIQETLSNIARHARAKKVAIKLTYDETLLTIEITDDGRGFDPTQIKAGMGLTNVRARMTDLGGAATIDSAPGRGSHLRLAIPLFRPRPVVDPALVEQRYTLAWQVGFAAGATGAASVYLLVAPLSPWLTPLAALVLAASVPIFWWRWQKLTALAPASYLPWMRRVDPIFSTLFGGSFAAFSGIIPSPSWLLLVMAGIGLVVSSGAIFMRSYAMRYSLHEWTTIAKEESQRLLLRVTAPIFVVTQLLWFFENGVASERTGWLENYLVENRFWLAWLLTIVQTMIMATLNLRWLRANHVAAGLILPPKEADPSITAPGAVRRMQVVAGGLTLLLLLLAFPTIGILLILHGTLLQWAVILVGLLICGLIGVKWRVEQRLSQQLAAWTTLNLLEKAYHIYRMILVFSLILLGGAIVGATVAMFEASDSSDEPITLATRLLAGVLLGWLIGLPIYAGLMTIVSSQRVRVLRQQVAEAQPGIGE